MGFPRHNLHIRRVSQVKHFEVDILLCDFEPREKDRESAVQGSVRDINWTSYGTISVNTWSRLAHRLRQGNSRMLTKYLFGTGC